MGFTYYVTGRGIGFTYSPYYVTVRFTYYVTVRDGVHILRNREWFTYYVTVRGMGSTYIVTVA